MKYISVIEAAKKWNISERSVRNYCSLGRVNGAVLDGKTWLIPDNSIKPERINGKDTAVPSEVDGLCEFLNASPVSFYAVKNVSDYLLDNGFKQLDESKDNEFKAGEKYFFKRNGSSLVALDIGENVNKKNCAFHIIASHSDSPCFKLKPECDGKTDIYNKVNVEPYGGMLCSTWLDRPLGIAGRVMVKENGKIVTKLVNFDENLLLIPNMCIHFNREANTGYSYNMASDMQAYIGQELEDRPVKDLLIKKLSIKEEDILNFDLYLYNHEQAIVWGQNKEYISSPRLDDLECVYLSTQALASSRNANAINVVYISDNEEVGSSSRQGADGDFLLSIINRVIESFGCSSADLGRITANSFLVSADNAHAVHPNNPGMTDSNNKCYMNKGIAIKFNASQSYTSDAVSSSIFQEICYQANAPYQFFTNRSDKRGGSTLGNILLSHLSFRSVDIGLPQLAMHSSFETAGAKDISYALAAFRKFYSSEIEIEDETYTIK